ncbi:MAG: hypothetical protein HXX16_09415 [Bacteroidales bacterium]|nr:hypothetical protein [Bacteroidales bacterium]
MKTHKQIVCKYFQKLIIIGLLLISFNSIGQANLKEIRVQGGNVQFIYNTLSKYTSGIDLVGYTRLNLRFNVTGSSGWILQLKSSNNDIVSDEGNPNIPIGSLQIEVASSSFTNDLNTTFNPTFSLSDTYSTFVEGDGGTGNPDIVLGQIVLTYKLPSMMNWKEGNYSVNLEFLLIEK